ncbi:MAG: glycosyltransferase [bacterium]|nr:glycosyltransferase [bacterium]
MKILQINKFYYRRRGAETYMLDLIELLEQKGYEVGVFSMDHPDNIQTPYSKYFLPYVEFGNLKALSMQDKYRAISRVIWSKEAQVNLDKLLAEFKPDIAHIHNIYHQISPSILKTLKKHNIPVIQTLHDYKLLAPNYNLLANGEIDESSKGHRYYNVVLKKGVKDSYSASFLAMVEMYTHKFFQVYEKNVDCFISPSQFLKDKVSEWGIKVKRMEVLPNFVNVSKIIPQYNNDGYFLYMGGLYKEKGVDLIIDIIDKIGYSIPLRIAGSGPEEATLKQLAKNKSVEFVGFLNKQELTQQISGAVAIIVPSRWYENYPFSVIEAFAHGKPVIAANIGGLPEQVIPGKTGALFEPNNSEDLQRVLTELLQKSETLPELGKTAREWVEQELSPEKHYARLYEIYSEYT